MQSNRHQVPPLSPSLNTLRSSHQKRAIAWLQVVGGFCLNVNTWGMLGSYGVFQSYYSSDLIEHSSTSAISWIGSLQGFFMFAFCFLTGPLLDAGHLHTLLWFGSCISVLGMFMVSLCSNHWQLILAQGIAMGIGFGCLYLPAPALVSMYFQEHQGLAIGISSSGSGIGAVVFPTVFTQLVPHIGFGWTVRVLGLILAVTSALPLAVMRFPAPISVPNDIYLNPKPENHESSGHTNHKSVLRTSILRSVDVSSLREKPFLLLVLGLLATFMGIYTTLYYVNLFAAHRTSASGTLASSTLTIVNGASTIGRILPSAKADKIGPTHVLAITAFLSAVLEVCLMAVSSAPGVVPWSVVFGSISGAFMGLPAAGVVSISISKETIGARLGTTLGMVGCGVLLAEPIAGAILGTHDEKWVGLIMWAASLMFTGSLLLLWARYTKAGSALWVKV